MLLLSTVATLTAAGTALASGQPIDWTIRTTFVGPQGEDLPLRIGSHDDALGDGFDERHIIDGHGEVPAYIDIQTLFETTSVGNGCTFEAGSNKSTCVGEVGDDTLVVVFTEREDPDSGGRPTGILTGYYLPRGCAC